MPKRPARRSVFIILIVVAAVVGLALALAQDQETLKLRSTVGAEDPGADAYVAALVGADLTYGNSYDVLVNGDQIFPAMFDAIDRATRRISFETYVYEQGDVADQFTAALERAAQRGVQVNIVVDTIGAAGMEDSHVERLRKAGCRVLMLNAPWYELEEINYRTHRKILVSSASSGGNNDMKRLYLLGLAMSRRSIDITTPYFVTDESSMWAFQDAVKRGVRIRILTESDVTDARPVKDASRAAFESLLALGIELYEYQPTMMHAKTFVVDGIWSTFGSANFDNRSLELNDELNLAVTSRDLASRLTEDFERDLRSARRLDLETWRSRPFMEKARERF